MVSQETWASNSTPSPGISNTGPSPNRLQLANGLQLNINWDSVVSKQKESSAKFVLRNDQSEVLNMVSVKLGSCFGVRMRRSYY